jgi:hypothetical protein
LKLLFLFLVGIAAAFIWLKKQNELKRQEKEIFPFYSKKPLSSPEQILYHRLVSALPGHIVLAQVQLSRVLAVKSGHNVQAWNNRINRMSLDFLICQKDFSIVAAMELDDKSHNQESRKEQDIKKNGALSAAGIRLIRWQVNALPDEATIQNVCLKQVPQSEALKSGTIKPAQPILSKPQPEKGISNQRNK